VFILILILVDIGPEAAISRDDVVTGDTVAMVGNATLLGETDADTDAVSRTEETAVET
jgi:hypothetical protein